jgi:DNA-binding transcriptional regulator YiaG
MKSKKKNTGPRWVRSRLIDGKLYRVLPDGTLGREVFGYFDPVKANGPAAFEPDEDTPILTARELKQFKRVNPNGGHDTRDEDVAKVRRKLRMSQAAFAGIFSLSVATVRDWEAKRRRPDGPARVLLRVIARDPDAVMRALA